MDEPKPSKGTPSRLACLACRQKHLKCDAKQPKCTRCISRDAECSYTASRRGYRGPSKEDSNGSHASFATTVTNANSFDLALQPPGSSPATTHDSTSTEHQTNASNAISIPSFGLTDGDCLLQQYYTYFHSAHPILIPLQQLVQLEFDAKYLVDVVRFIGLQFARSQDSGLTKSTVQSQLDQAPDDSPFKVQALLLMAIALHATHDHPGSHTALHKAIDIALHIGLHSKNFALARGFLDPMLQESLRRTWWELYCVEGMLSAFHQKTGFRTDVTAADVELPCDECYFHHKPGVQPLRTIDELEGRFFDDNERAFSSYCYRIDAVKLLSRVLSVSGDYNGPQDEVNGIDAALVAWVHHLPPERYEILDSNGHCDEMLFQAHLIIYAALIHLHVPRSTLQLSRPSNAGIECTRKCQIITPASTYHTHAVKAVNAAGELTALASLPTNIFKHTPIFACGLVVSAVVQLSACAINTCNCLQPHRDRIVQSIGMLKTLDRAWPLAGAAMTQVRIVAREIQQLGVKSFAADPAGTLQDSRTMGETSWAPDIASMLESSDTSLYDFMQFDLVPSGWDFSAMRP